MVTNNRCVSEHTKNDKVENVATVGVKVGKVGKSENAKSIVMNEVESW